MTAMRSILFEEILDAGWLPFERFMDLALYHPVHGYYETGREVGRAGDFYTSVSAGALFAQLLAREFAAWAAESDVRVPVSWIECGAHHGKFASDFCDSLRLTAPDLWPRFSYWILEPSEARRARQENSLASFGGHCRWVADLEAFDAKSISGTVFSNELLDAMPVRRVVWNSGKRRWMEWGVILEGGSICWSQGALTGAGRAAVQEVLARIGADAFSTETTALLEALPDGFTVDLCPAACAWWSNAASKLSRGRLMTFDYALNTPELFSPARAEGTLRAYRGHRLVKTVLENPGEQDLTSHVDFDALEAAGSREGLTTLARMSQGQYLTRLAAGMDAWTPSQIRQFQTLTHPAHLGLSHSVLVQGV